MKEFKMKIASTVLYFALKPNWASHNISYFADQAFKRSFTNDVKSLEKQLVNVIPR